MPLAWRFLLLALLVIGGHRASAAAAIAARPFASPPSPAGATLFTRLSPDQTGLQVENRYDDPQMWGTRYRAFMGGGMGSGVAAGDFDGDGRVDLYVSTKTKPGRLFRNLGGWRFQDVTDAAGLGDSGSILGWLRQRVGSDAPVVWRQGAVFADINNDSHLDLYVCRNDAPNLLYVNQGNGTFTEEGEARGLGIVDGSVVGAFADYDRDGWLDVLILTNQVDGTEPNGRADRLFRNTGAGRFVEVTRAAGIESITFGHAATWFDYNGDRWPDLYLANDFSGPDFLYRNNQDGTFTNVIHEVVPHTPYSSMGADTADVNNDGQIDLLVADMATTTREKDRRGLAASQNDVLRTGLRDGIAPQYMRNMLLLNTGLGVFREAACWAGIAATDWTWSVRFEDFDHDGWVDLHVTNGMVREANNTDLLARMMRALSDLERIRVMKDAPPLAESNLAYRNLGGDRFVPVTREWGLEDVGVTFGAATADLDADGDLDLAYLDYDGGLAVFRNDVAGRRRVQIRLRGTRSNRLGIGAVVRVEAASTGRQSRTMTVARGYAAGSEIVAQFGLGADATINRLVVEWPSGQTQVFTDLPADQAYLITEANDTNAPPEPAPVPRFRAAAAEFNLAVVDASPPSVPDREQPFLPFRTDRRGPGAAVADFNGDGHDDLYLGATPGSPARMLHWRNGRYHEVAAPVPPTPAPAAEEGPPLAFDADGDGDVDLLVTRASAAATAWPQAYQPVLYANDGQGRLTPTDALPELAVNTGAVAAADIDADGDLDLFLGARSVPGRYPESPTSMLLRNDAGRFAVLTGAAELATVGLVKSALFRDVDQDGRPDLVLALEWDHVRYFHNEGNGGFTDRTDAAGFATGGRGWWNSLAAADFNGDGRVDFAAGNLGLNTTYHASPAEPAMLLDGDFARNGTRLLVEAVHDQGRLYPRRSRVDLGARLPSVLRRYPKNDDFARATLDEVFGAEAVAAARSVTADNFSSGVFLSQPDGTHRFSPLPRLAQIGPIHGLVAADLNGDGVVDLAAVNNSDAAIPGFHGGVGLLLQGRGTGTFEAVAARDSGLLVPGQARALVLLDVQDDARPDLFVTRHGATSDLLVNHAEADRPWITVRLRGAAANAGAIGARVHLTYSDGSTFAHEVGLGGGWFSQSSAALHLASAPGRRLVAADVTWPEGRRSRHTDVPVSGTWIIAAPAP